MFTLKNEYLEVAVLDPVADAAHLGSRYCTGGYMWQITDAVHGKLLAGPQFPDSDPRPFDGQGAPEAFVTPLGRDDCSRGETVMVIGVGSVVRSSDTTPFHTRDNPEVAAWCRWIVDARPAEIHMSTLQKTGPLAIVLSRTVGLRGRSVISTTTVTSQSEVTIPLRWFPHPFFPRNSTGQCCTIAVPWSVPENPGYEKSDEGVLCMKREYPWEKGLFMQLAIRPGGCFTAGILHECGAVIGITADYPLDSLPVWANKNTFSPEPYFSCCIAPGAVRTWKIEYTVR